MEGSNTMNVLELLKTYSINVDKEIEKALDTVDPEELHDASKHLIKAGGKKIRPSLVLISSEAVGGSVEGALKTAAAVELIHTFSLIHDDIMDQRRDEKRNALGTYHMG